MPKDTCARGCYCWTATRSRSRDFHWVEEEEEEEEELYLRLETRERVQTRRRRVNCIKKLYQRSEEVSQTRCRVARRKNREPLAPLVSRARALVSRSMRKEEKGGGEGELASRARALSPSPAAPSMDRSRQAPGSRPGFLLLGLVKPTHVRPPLTPLYFPNGSTLPPPPPPTTTTTTTHKRPQTARPVLAAQTYDIKSAVHTCLPQPPLPL
jgi:hypothetical protein